MSDRIITGDPQIDDAQERAMRPQTLADYRGQPQVLSLIHI